MATKKRKATAKAGKVITCTVASLGSEPIEVRLTAKAANVMTALAMAGIAPQPTQQVWCNGEQVDFSRKVADGDMLVLVSPKAAGAKRAAGTR